MDGKADGSRTETDGVRRGRPLRFLAAHLRKGKRESLAFAHDILASMIRLIFTEQIYRAMTIINGEPYHHE